MREAQSVMVGKSQQRKLKAAGLIVSLFMKQREMLASFYFNPEAQPMGWSAHS